MKPLDFIGAIELAYDRSKQDAAWLEDLMRAISPAFSTASVATTAFFFHLERDQAAIGTTVSVGEKPYAREHYEKQHEAGRDRDRPTRVAYDCDMFTVLSRVIGPEEARRTISMAGMAGDDALGLRANMTPDRGAIFTTHVPLRHRIRQRDLWTRFAAHVGSALRLHPGRRFQCERNFA